MRRLRVLVHLTLLVTLLLSLLAGGARSDPDSGSQLEWQYRHELQQQQSQHALAVPIDRMATTTTCPTSTLEAAALAQCVEADGAGGVVESYFGGLLTGGPCTQLLPQKTLFALSVFGGLFGLDHLYARNLQLFLPKIFLTLFLTPYSWRQMMSRPTKEWKINWILVAVFGFFLVLSHVWWIVDVCMWGWNRYSTGMNGAWFGNPLDQCPTLPWTWPEGED